MIRRIAEKIEEGTKFFLGHGATNDQEGRESVGEVITSFVKEIGGRLSHVIVGHFPNEEKVRNMDVCSMEADIYADDENIVGDINKVSGVALASSDIENPAFPGALRLGTVQCFDQKLKNKEKTKMTFDEIKSGIREFNVYPWQLFTLEDIKNDRIYGKLFEDNDKLKAENEKLSKENKEVLDKSKEAIHKLDVSNAQGRLDGFMKDLTDKQKTFITKQFKPELLEKLDDDGLKEFIENSKKEFAETARLFGVEKIEDLTKKKGGEGEEGSSETMEEQALKELGVTENG